MVVELFTAEVYGKEFVIFGGMRREQMARGSGEEGVTTLFASS